MDILPVAELEKMASKMARLFGKNQDDLVALMLIAQAEGLHPAIAAQEYDVIQGRPAITSRAALARFQRSGGSIEWLERSAEKASARFSHPQGGALVVTWDKAKATLAGLWGKENWKKYPEAMLSARVVSEGVRAVYPACLSQLYTVEEVQDFEPRSVTPQAPALELAEPKAEAAPIEDADLVKRMVAAKASKNPKAATLIAELGPQWSMADRARRLEIVEAVEAVLVDPKPETPKTKQVGAKEADGAKESTPGVPKQGDIF